MPTPITTDRTNVTQDGYEYGGVQYKKETRYDAQNQPYVVDIPITPAPAPVATQTSTPSTEKTAGQIYDFGSEDPDLAAALSARTQSARESRDEVIDEDKIRANKLAEMQAEIDAQNAIYADKIRVAKVKGLGRLGTSTAVQGRRGLLGSDFGNAQTDNVETANTEIEDSIKNELAVKISALMSDARTNADAEIAAKRAAKEAGLNDYIKYLQEDSVRKQTNTEKVINALIAQGLDPETMDAKSLEAVAKGYGIKVSDIKTAYQLQKYTSDKATKDAETKRKQDIEDALAKKGVETIGEGQSGYRYNPETKQYELVASVKKTFAPTSGTGTGSGAGGYGIDANGKQIAISPKAQVYVDAVNNGANLDDILKGTSKEVQALRGEVVAGLNLQGGQSKKVVDILSEGKKVVDDMIATNAHKALGGYSSVFGGQLTLPYGDAKAKATQLSAILARDNLGLLKGAMSDKDLAFIQAMSTGFEGQGIQSEKYISDRLLSIQENLRKKIESSGFPLPDAPTKQVEYQGKIYNVAANGDMTPVE